MKKEFLLNSLRQRGFSKKIVGAFEKVDRSEFVPSAYFQESYLDKPLPIGHEQTISQPYTIAFMLELLQIKDRQKILEVGSGSGYVLALLSELNSNGKVFGAERIKELVEDSREKLKRYKNIKVIHSDGSRGLGAEALFDRILVSASAKEIPQKLVEQLKVGGVLVVPVKQSIIKIQKLIKNKNKIEEFPGFVFVPLIEN